MPQVFPQTSVYVIKGKAQFDREAQQIRFDSQENDETMRRFRKLIVPVLFAFLFVASNVFQNILASVGWDRVKDHPFVQNWGVLIQVGFVVMLTVIYVLWDAWRVREITEEPGDHPLRMRQRLMDRVLEFAQSQFDGGLYAKARKEFHLAERPLHVTTEDRVMDVTIEPFGVKFAVTCREAEYRDLKAAIDVPSAVVVRTLSGADVASFLESNAPKFSGLRQALHAEPPLCIFG